VDAAGREGEDQVPYAMLLRRGGWFAAAFVALFSALLLPLTPTGRAQSQLAISVAPVDAPIGVGEEAPFVVRVSGADAAALDIRYEVEGGVLVGLLAPAQVGPETFEAVAYVRRDTPGVVTLRVSAGGVTASASVEAILAGRIRIQLTVHDVVQGASRSWPFEVVDAAGVVVARVNVAASGGFPGTSDTILLPYGTYTVRQVLGVDTGLSCSEGRFFAVRQPPGGMATVSVFGPRSVTEFAVDVCPFVAPPSVSPTPTPVEAVAGERTPGPAMTPLPPAAGTGLERAPRTSSGLAFLLVGVGLAAGGGTLLAAGQWRR
jgi:hypothetical protein